MPRGRGQPPREIPAGTVFGVWTVIREVERAQDKARNRRFLCRCAKCGEEKVKYLSNIVQGYSCKCSVDLKALAAAGRGAVIAARRARSQESDEGRICLTCATFKPWSAFPPDKRRERGKGSNCYECGKWRTVKAYLGITRAEWEWLHEAQKARCALCGEPENKNSRLSVDHDHACHADGRACKGCIRGLLCDLCNRMLGLVEQREANVARFADYLVRRPFLVPAGPTVAIAEGMTQANGL